MQYNYDLITITLNSAKTLTRTLNSVLKQSKLPRRYIFIDANSQDGTLEIIEKFKIENDKFEIIVEQQTGKGISQAWNQALRHCQSDIIALLNSDDWWEENCISKVLEEFSMDKNLEILSGSILYHFNQNDSSPKKMSPKSPWQMSFRMCFMHPATFVKKSVYEKIGSFNENYQSSMDYDFMFRALKAKINIKTSSEILTHMLAGGQANSTRDSARSETCEIARKNGHKFMAASAYFLRKMFNR